MLAEVDSCNSVKHVATHRQHPAYLSDQRLTTGRLVGASWVLCLCHTHDLVACTMLACHKVHQIGRPARGCNTRSEAGLSAGRQQCPRGCLRFQMQAS